MSSASFYVTTTADAVTIRAEASLAGLAGICLFFSMTVTLLGFASGASILFAATVGFTPTWLLLFGVNYLQTHAQLVGLLERVARTTQQRTGAQRMAAPEGAA